MTNSNELALEHLVIKEANGSLEISLNDVPKSGATAVVPKPPTEHPGDIMQITVGKRQTPEIALGEVNGRNYEFPLAKEWLLDSVGTGEKLEFKYVIFDGALGNRYESDPIGYTIVH